MYLRKLELKRVKLIKDLTLDFTRDGEPRMWTVIVGENGTCKTTILQAIALAASGSLVANMLAGGSEVRQGIVQGLQHRLCPKTAPRWTATFGLNALVDTGSIDRPSYLVSEVKNGVDFDDLLCTSDFGQLKTYRGERENPLDKIRRKKTAEPHWFVAGYGVQRNSVGRALPRMKPEVERLVSLFGGRELRGLGFERLFRDDPERSEFADLYQETLNRVLLHEGLLPDVTHIDLGAQASAHLPELGQQITFRQAGKPLNLPATWLSQGYQSSIAWIADLVGQILLEAREAVEPDKMEGLVLVDEIDLHLHPTWQVGLIEALRSVFPKLQFIATTHSPLVLPALVADEVIMLDLEHGEVVKRKSVSSPRDMTGTQLYRHYFEVKDLIPGRVGRLRWNYMKIVSNPYRTDGEEASLAQLIDDLDKVKARPDIEVVPREAL